MIDERIPMTKEGYEKKKGDLDRITNTAMIAVNERFGFAPVARRGEFQKRIDRR